MMGALDTRMKVVDGEAPDIAREGDHGALREEEEVLLNVNAGYEDLASFEHIHFILTCFPGSTAFVGRETRPETRLEEEYFRLTDDGVEELEGFDELLSDAGRIWYIGGDLDDIQKIESSIVGDLGRDDIERCLNPSYVLDYGRDPGGGEILRDEWNNVWVRDSKWTGYGLPGTENLGLRDVMEYLGLGGVEVAVWGDSYFSEDEWSYEIREPTLSGSRSPSWNRL